MSSETLLKDRKVLLLTLLAGALAVLWLYAHFVNPKESFLTFFTNTYGLVALFGGLAGLVVAHKWGGFGSYLGKSVGFFSLGLLMQELGQVLYMYYIYVLKIEIPYPSLGDFGFFGSIPMYIMGAFYIGKVLGLSGRELGSFKNRLVAFVACLSILLTTYFVLMRNYEYDFSAPLSVALDFGYPLGQAMYLFIGLVVYFVSVKSLGGALRKNVLALIVALTLQYASDFMFLYKARNETWIPGGPNDFLYLISYYVMAVAVLSFHPVLEHLKNGKTIKEGSSGNN